MMPKLRFPGFGEEWRVKVLGDYFESISSGKSSTVSDGKNYNIYGSTGKIGLSNDYDYAGDKLLIARVGANAGSMYRVGGEYKVSDNTLILELSGELDISFTQALLEKSNLKRLVFGSGQPLVTGGQLKKIRLAIPKKEEQQMIAESLGAVDKKIDLLSKKTEQLEKYKKGVMQKIFSQEIRFKDENGQSFPDWEEKPGSDIFQNVSERNNGQPLPILAITQDKGAVPRDQINYDISVTDASVNSYKVVRKGDFIISLRSFQGGIEYSDFDGICSPAYIVLRPSISINKTFYQHYLKSHDYIQSLTKKLEGIRDGKMISFKYFSEVFLPYPSPDEQTEIANLLTGISIKIDAEERKLGKAKEFKKALLQQMFV